MKYQYKRMDGVLQRIITFENGGTYSSEIELDNAPGVDRTSDESAFDQYWLRSKVTPGTSFDRGDIRVEQELNAPKIMSKIEFSQHTGLASKSDGIHLLATTEHGRPFNQLVFGASNIEGDLNTAVDRAFERIVSIEQNADSEFKTVENTAYGLMFDNSTVEYLRDVMVPRKQFQYKPDMAFGLFLGYSLKIDPPVADPALYRTAAEEQLKRDVESVKGYIADTMKQHKLEGYTFYCYVLPFNDAPNEKTSLIDEMLEGR